MQQQCTVLKKNMLIHATLNFNMSINVTDMFSAKEKPDLPMHGLPPPLPTHIHLCLSQGITSTPASNLQMKLGNYSQRSAAHKAMNYIP